MTPIGRNGWIDVLRALGAMAVALFHFNSVPLVVPTGAGPWHAVWLHGHWGVAVFFCLSGYCLLGGWERATSAQGFLVRRLRRVFPPYWCSLLLVAAVAGGAKLFSGVNDVTALPGNIGAILTTIFLATNPLTPVPTVNWVYWTLTCVVAFYLVTSLLLLAKPAHRLALLATLHVLLCLADSIFHPAPVGVLFLVSYWPIFGGGLALAVLHTARRPGVIMLLASLLHVIWAIGRGTNPTHYVLIGACTTALLAVLLRCPFPAWLRPLARVGEFSYSLYLIHVPVGVYLLMRFLPNQFASASAYVGTQLLQLAACLSFARLFYLLAERPFLPPAGLRPA